MKATILNSAATCAHVQFGSRRGTFCCCLWFTTAVCVGVSAEMEPDVLEEDVFQDEVVSSFLSPLQTDSMDFPDTPVSFTHITNVPNHSAKPQFLLLSGGQI